MDELTRCPCANTDVHEAHDYPVEGPNWTGPPEWHCPGREVALSELLETMEPALPGISAAKFREDLRTTFLVTGLPVFMFGVVLHLWSGWLLMFFAGLLVVTLGLDVLQRVRRVRAIEQRGELP